MPGDMSAPTAQLWEGSPFEQVETIALWSEDPGRANRRKVNEYEEELRSSEKQNKYVLCKESSSDSVGKYTIRLEVEMVVEDNFIGAVEVILRGVVTVLLGETIEDVSTRIYDEKKGGVKTPIRSMVGGALTDIVEQGTVANVLVCHVK